MTGPRKAAQPTVVVGVDGSNSALAALDWAVEYASRHDWAVRLVSAYPSTETMGAGWSEPPEEVRGSAIEVLTTARQHVRSNHSSLSVECIAECGAAHRVLSRHGRSADMVVLGRSRRNRLSALIARSAAELVPEHALAPTVVVPELWVAGREPDEPVLLGLDASDESDRALHFAFDFAEDVGTPLNVIAVARPLVAYSAVLALIAGKADWIRVVEEDCMERLAPWRDRYPRVEARLHVEEGEPAALLERWSRRGRILVIGGHPHGIISGQVLGSLAPLLIAHSHCPVAVVHATPVTDQDHQPSMAAGPAR
jgi:nucleotide-binding universal stress UspA family protein